MYVYYLVKKNIENVNSLVCFIHVNCNRLKIATIINKTEND